MPRPRRFWSAALGVALLLATAACNSVSINELLSNPGKYRNRDVTVHGTVAESASVLGRGAYKLSDGDAELWVVTASGAPRKGAHVKATGRVQDGYDLSAFGGALKLPGALQSGLVLVESSHKAD
jgi:hypothetical protein